MVRVLTAEKTAYINLLGRFDVSGILRKMINPIISCFAMMLIQLTSYLTKNPLNVYQLFIILILYQIAFTLTDISKSYRNL